MKRQPIESSNIKAIGYNGEKLILEIEFHSGQIYQAQPISKEGYKTFMESESKGSYYHQHIKSNPLVNITKIQ
jgi:hypothetical protein